MKHLRSGKGELLFKHSCLQFNLRTLMFSKYLKQILLTKMRLFIELNLNALNLFVLIHSIDTTLTYCSIKKQELCQLLLLSFVDKLALSWCRLSPLCHVYNFFAKNMQCKLCCNPWFLTISMNENCSFLVV